MNVSTAEVCRLLDDANDALAESYRQIGILEAERDELLAACWAALEDLIECADGDTSTVVLIRAAITKAEGGQP